MPPSAIFIRPKNIPLSTLLQSLSITANFARRTGGKVTHSHAPREPYSQRLLGYSGLTMTDQETVRSLSNTFEHYIPLTSRAALPYSALYYELPVEERGASLADVASIVGMRLAVGSAKSTGRGGTGAAADDGVGSERPVSSMECKIERRQTAARNRPSNKSIAQEARNRRQLVDAMNNFGGFSGHIQVSHSR